MEAEAQTKALAALTAFALPSPPMPDDRKIIDLADHRPHIAGPARCAACGAQWIAVAPVGTSWLECDGCGSEKVLFVGPVRDDVDHIHCHCGGELFAVTDARTYCPLCGLTLGERPAP